MRVNTPLQLLILVAVVVVTSATFTQHAPAQELFNGGEVILSTNHFQHFVQARADTVCVFAFEGQPTVRPKLLQLGIDLVSWDSIEVYGSEEWGDAPGMSSMVGFENRFDTTLKQTVGTIWIARSINDVRIVNVGREGDLAPGHKIHKVVAHHYNPDVVIVATYRQNWHYQTAHITTDGGITWKKFMPAYLARDYYREYYYGFDARNPQRIHIGINGENPNDPFSLGYRSVYTDDWGERFIDTVINIDGNPQDYRLANTEQGLGIWSGKGGLSCTDPSFTGTRYWRLTSDSLYLSQGQSPRRVQLPWHLNARRSLLPDIDTTTNSLLCMMAPLGFHHLTPELIMAQFKHKFRTEAGNDSMYIMAMSNDFGDTWQKMMTIPPGNGSIGKPIDFLSFTRCSIDPYGTHLYITYRHTIYDSLTNKFVGTAHTARWRNVPTGVGTGESSTGEASDFIVTPNPVAGNASLRLNYLQPRLPEALVRIYGANGELVFTLAETVQAANSMDVTLPGLSQGVYFIVLSDHTSTRSAKFIVLE